MKPYEFQVRVEPRTTPGFERSKEYPFEPRKVERTVYDLKVTDSRNAKLLVFSNQGYENRQDARDLAVKLFAGRPALLVVLEANGLTVAEELQLDAL